MQHLSLDALRAFVSVYELQSYTAAGRQLGRSQPAISLQLQRLEEQLGSTLVNRVGGRIQLTFAGSELLESARQLLGLNDQIFARFTEPAISGRIRLGIPSEFANQLLPQVLGQFSQSYPHVTLAVTSALSKTLLQQDAADFDVLMLLTEPGQKPASRRPFTVLKQEPLVWVGAQAEIATAELNPLKLVLAPDGCIYRRRALRLLKQHDIAAQISYTNADFSGLTAAIESGLGCTVLAQSTVPAHLHRLQHPQLPLLGEVSVALQVVDSENAAAQQLAAFIRDRI